MTMGLTPYGVALPGQAVAYPFIAGIVRVIDFLLAWATFAAVVVVIYAGIRIILSMGKAETVTKARQLIIRALIGLAAISVSFALVHFVITAIV